MNIEPGDIVRHTVKQHKDSDFIGFVRDVVTTKGIGWQATTVNVRWIKDSDDPSDGCTAHVPEELELVSRPTRGVPK